MTVKECYKEMAGDYDEAIHRLGSDERIIKYLKILQRDTNFDFLCEAIAQNNLNAAFCAAHTLKGIALNLSLTSLADSTKELTELLRSGMPNKNTALLLQKTKQAYALVLECINALLNI